MSCGRWAMPWPTTPEQADLVVLNTCHIREKASEKVYSELGRLRDIKRRAPRRGPRPHHRRRRLRRPGRGRGDHAPPARRRHRRRPAGLSPAARAAGRGRAQVASAAPASACRAPACSTPTSRPRASSTTCRRRRACAPARPSCRSRKAATSSAPSASCPTRAAPSIRGRPAAIAGRGAPAGGARARVEITLLGQNVNAYHGEAADGSTWSLARLIRALAEIEGLARIRYTTSPSARHGRRADRRPWRGAAADALPASAGAVRLRPHPRGDEPPHTAAISSCAWSIACAPRGPTSRCRPTSSSASRARATPISTTRCGWSTRWASPRPSPSSTAAGPARRARRCRTRCRRAVKAARLAAPAGAARPSRRAPSTPRKVGATVPVLFAEPAASPAS